MDLKNFIKDNRLSQKEIADLFACHPSNISNIVKGIRNVTKPQMRLLVQTYGFDKVAQYATGDEMPDKASITINAPVITDNTAPVQAGNGNSMDLPPDAGIIEVLRQQSNQITTLLSQQQTMLAHQERLIALLEKNNT